MVVKFNKIKLYNFCSYAEAEIELNDKGFCLVSGRNSCKKDNALSNGSGKSTIWSAICYALTGETISGLKSNFKNINLNLDDGFVELDFNVDTDNYIVTRYFSPKSDLKVIKNNIDISGKGIRESTKILSENLPDLTKDLISSTIIFGQGMPNKFSSFNPVGRKELLEKLTKSDFMIEDIKVRIANRLASLNQDLRKYEDSLLVANTQLTINKTTLSGLEHDKANFKILDYDNLIANNNKNIDLYAKQLEQISNSLNQLDQELEQANEKIIELSTQKAEASKIEADNYAAAYNAANSEKVKKETEIAFIKSELSKIKNIKDVCPTCGQKIPGVLKPNTDEQEKQLQIYNNEYAEIIARLNQYAEKHKGYLQTIDSSFSEIPTLTEKIKLDKQQVNNLKAQFNNYTEQLNAEKEKLIQNTFDKNNANKVFNTIVQKIDEVNTNISQITTEINLTSAAKLEIDSHIAVVKKIESLVKRDFRGYLLYNIIDYLNKKSKEYSKIVFNNEELNICLDGNAIDISFAGKVYESLSGGEKQRVDIIVQFAIRDLLQTYFNYSSNILVLDEITDNLDKLATNRIFDLITNKLRDIKSIFIISHHDDELDLPVDSELQIIKDENGISSVKEF